VLALAPDSHAADKGVHLGDQEAQGAVDSGSGVEPGAVAGAAPSAAADVWTGLTEHARMNAEQRRRLLGLCEEARARRLDFEAAVRQLRLLEEAVTRYRAGGSYESV